MYCRRLKVNGHSRLETNKEDQKLHSECFLSLISRGARFPSSITPDNIDAFPLLSPSWLASPGL
jgi:hypothetical protein